MHKMFNLAGLKTLLRAAALVALLYTNASFAAKPYSNEGIVLLQPEFLLQERVTVDDLGNYIKAVVAAATATLATENNLTPSAGFLVFAIRPEGTSKTWLDFNPALPAALDARLRAALDAVPPCKTQRGVVVFAIDSSLSGASSLQREPAPAEWKKALKTPTEKVEIAELMDRVWPGRGK
ncbi:MAG: hypothetical protein ABI411_20865 [Tahibacter sp.]